MRLYIDEDAMANALIDALRSRGFDVETVAEVNLRAVADVEHLRHAARQGRTLYSFNRRDFIRIHSEFLAVDESHAGIILLSRRTNDVGTQLRGLISIATILGNAGMTNSLRFI